MVDFTTENYNFSPSINPRIFNICSGALMKRISVILVRPKYPGNIGAVARVMSNFDVSDLILVDSIMIDQEARNRAKHANFILNNSRTVDTLDAAIMETDLNIGTTGIKNTRQTGHIRNPLTPHQLFEQFSSDTGRIGLVFGREDTGLLDEELKKLDLLISLPTSGLYPVMNLSHAVAVVLWEFFRRGGIPGKFIEDLKETSSFEREKMVKSFMELMEAINYPPHRRENTGILFRRMIGRSIPTKWEFHTLMGVLTGAVRRIKRDDKSVSWELDE